MTWFSTQAKLPKLHRDVLGLRSDTLLVWVDDADNGNQVAFGYYLHRPGRALGWWRAHGFGGNHEWNITHWQYLPKPPTGKKP